MNTDDTSSFKRDLQGLKSDLTPEQEHMYGTPDKEYQSDPGPKPKKDAFSRLLAAGLRQDVELQYRVAEDIAAYEESEQASKTSPYSDISNLTSTPYNSPDSSPVQAAIPDEKTLRQAARKLLNDVLPRL